MRDDLLEEVSGSKWIAGMRNCAIAKFAMPQFSNAAIPHFRNSAFPQFRISAIPHFRNSLQTPRRFSKLPLSQGRLLAKLRSDLNLIRGDFFVLLPA